MTQERARCSFKLKIKLFNQYIFLFNEKKVINLKQDQIKEELHFDFHLKEKYLINLLTIHFKMILHSFIKSSYLKHLFEKNECNHNLQSKQSHRAMKSMRSGNYLHEFNQDAFLIRKVNRAVKTWCGKQTNSIFKSPSVLGSVLNLK